MSDKALLLKVAWEVRQPKLVQEAEASERVGCALIDYCDDGREFWEIYDAMKGAGNARRSNND